jgi:hypothetical protein
MPFALARSSLYWYSRVLDCNAMRRDLLRLSFLLMRTGSFLVKKPQGLLIVYALTVTNKNITSMLSEESDVYSRYG